MKDPALGLASLQAYNDWMIEEWCATDRARFIPCQLPWLSDPERGGGGDPPQRRARVPRGELLGEPRRTRVREHLRHQLGPVLRRVRRDRDHREPPRGLVGPHAEPVRRLTARGDRGVVPAQRDGDGRRLDLRQGADPPPRAPGGAVGSRRVVGADDHRTAPSRLPAPPCVGDVGTATIPIRSSCCTATSTSRRSRTRRGSGCSTSSARTA